MWDILEDVEQLTSSVWIFEASASVCVQTEKGQILMTKVTKDFGTKSHTVALLKNVQTVSNNFCLICYNRQVTMDKNHVALKGPKSINQLNPRLKNG